MIDHLFFRWGIHDRELIARRAAMAGETKRNPGRSTGANDKQCSTNSNAAPQEAAPFKPASDKY